MGARRAWTVSMISPLSMLLQLDGGDAEVAVCQQELKSAELSGIE
jgi:hypothetical protein